MEIYGLGIVTLCMFIGSFIGRALGVLIGINGDIGGVGFAMLIMILLSNYFDKKGKPFSEKTGRGIQLLSSLYIPIVVAMSSIQNVVAAFEGGVVAILAGGVATIGSMFLVPLISRLSREGNSK